MIITRPDGTFGCTANFVWKEARGDVYLGAAGHCFLPETAVATHGPGANYDPAQTRVRVCISACNFGGQTGFLITGNLVDLGPVVYARQVFGGQQVGHDFGIVQIPAVRSTIVRPHMEVWNGPTIEATMGLGTVALHYGHAGGLGETFVTQARAGAGAGSNANAWFANTPSFQGDSGGAMNNGVVRTTGTTVLEGRGAIGLITHLVVGTGIVAGTTVTRAKSMATEAGLSLSIVFQGQEAFTAPTAPRALTAAPGPGAGQIQLNWQPPASHGGFAITSYKVYRAESGQAVEFVDEVPGATLSFTDSDLPNGATRTYQVSAVNQAGEGLRSLTAAATTHLTPTAPTNATAAAGPGRGEVTLQWQAPASDGGLPVTGYRVYEPQSQGLALVATLGSDAVNFTHMGLLDDSNHAYRIGAVNEAGEGELTDVLEATTFGIPGAPHNLTATAGSRTVHLQWSPPEGRGLPILQYTITYERTVGSPRTNTLTTTETQATITGLRNGVSYRFWVTATNEVGEGPVSEQTTARPMRDLPPLTP